MAFPSSSRLMKPALWILLGGILASTLGPADLAPIAVGTLEASSAHFSIETTGSERFQFFTFRRSTWILDIENYSLRFVSFPDGPDQPFVTSGIYSIDRDAFPAEDMEIQLSQRTLSNYLWLVNKNSGAAMYITALRDGGFHASKLFTAES